MNRRFPLKNSCSGTLSAPEQRNVALFVLFYQILVFRACQKREDEDNDGTENREGVQQVGLAQEKRNVTLCGTVFLHFAS